MCCLNILFTHSRVIYHMVLLSYEVTPSKQWPLTPKQLAALCATNDTEDFNMPVSVLIIGPSGMYVTAKCREREMITVCFFILINFLKKYYLISF